MCVRACARVRMSIYAYVVKKTKETKILPDAISKNNMKK